MSGGAAHNGDVDEPPDDTNPLLFTAVFLGAVVVVIATLYGFFWLMYSGN